VGTKTNTNAVYSANAARRMDEPDDARARRQPYPVATMNGGALTREAEIRSAVKPQRLVGSPRPARSPTTARAQTGRRRTQDLRRWERRESRQVPMGVVIRPYQASLLSPGADNHSDRGVRSIVPVEKRRLAGKVEAAGIEPRNTPAAKRA
jgi:hypothetical protein